MKTMQKRSFEKNRIGIIESHLYQLANGSKFSFEIPANHKFIPKELLCIQIQKQFWNPIRSPAHHRSPRKARPDYGEIACKTLVIKWSI